IETEARAVRADGWCRLRSIHHLTNSLIHEFTNSRISCLCPTASSGPFGNTGSWSAAVGLWPPRRGGRGPACARDEGRWIEDGARQVRYAFLNEAAARLDADVGAVGHSRDDQA